MKKIPADPWSKSSCEQLESVCAWVEGLDKSILQAYHCVAAAGLGVYCEGGQEERGC